MKNIFSKGLKKSRSSILQAFSYISGKSTLNSLDIERFEEMLIQADIDLETIDIIVDELKEKQSQELPILERVKNGIRRSTPKIPPLKPSKITMLVGVNGSGKTTFCAKYAKRLTDKGKKVLLIAADTYRAAAHEQIQYWGESYGIECIANLNKKDPSSVIFDALNSNAAKDSDNVIIDSAGRLHNSVNLMKELRKMSGVIKKFDYSCQNLISIDAIMGKNALNQIRLFDEYIDIDGIILNKMDGTAKGGIAISIIRKYEKPICFLGLGEKIDDIATFDMDLFLETLLNENEEN